MWAPAPGGKLWLQFGPMFSFKTTAAMRRAKSALIGDLTVGFYVPAKDTRNTDQTLVVDHDGTRLDRIHATVINDPKEILVDAIGKDILIIDEVQFFPVTLAAVVFRLFCEGKTIFAFGLDTTWDGKIWKTSAALLALPGAKKEGTKAVCPFCRQQTATMSQRIDEKGIPVPLGTDPKTIRVGSKELYRPLCRTHWLITTPNAIEWMAKGKIGTLASV